MPNQSANEDGIIIRPDTTASAVIPYIMANLPSVSKSFPRAFRPEPLVKIGPRRRICHRGATMWTHHGSACGRK
ncbi:hypothetical protein EMO89_09915 [Bifidobacterium tissieri]|uniref:Uncharacterized protein n=1 Tax=Bifidobacterium tissieri TaxID=1630162 RepID=A0A5M9ZUV8_9BIFI|nr:hypothetical protein EMO89_09915 [Bifidobacterium tissieri]KAA8831249.1 hypothetical protein EM849_08015 [Bifidobacterium tissieri]